MKKISKRRFVYCYYHDREVPEEGSGCCDFYSTEGHKCEYNKYRISKRSFGKSARITEREEIINQYTDEENN